MAFEGDDPLDKQTKKWEKDNISISYIIYIITIARLENWSATAVVVAVDINRGMLIFQKQCIKKMTIT